MLDKWDLRLRYAVSVEPANQSAARTTRHKASSAVGQANADGEGQCQQSVRCFWAIAVLLGINLNRLKYTFCEQIKRSN